MNSLRLLSYCLLASVAALSRGVASLPEDTAAPVAAPVLRVEAPAEPATPAPSESPLTQERFLSLLSREITAHYNLEGDLQVEMLRSPETPNRVARDWQLVLLEYPSVPSAAMVVRCRIQANGVNVADVPLVLRASLWRDVWVTRQPLVNGAMFDPSLLDVRRVDLFRERDVVPASVGDRTFIFARSIQAGRLLTWRDIGRRPLVRKGEVVDVSAADGMLNITMKGLAMQNGAQGEAITVRNLDSKKDFTAFVIDENRVQVRF